MEELVLSTIKHIDALGGVLHCMGVNHIQQYPDTHFMSLVHQVFQILRLTKPGGSCEEAGHLITKGTVIRMLHNGHQLHGIVACFLDSGQGVIRKLPVGADVTVLLSHTHMGFVNIK